MKNNKPYTFPPADSIPGLGGPAQGPDLSAFDAEALRGKLGPLARIAALGRLTTKIAAVVAAGKCPARLGGTHLGDCDCQTPYGT